MQIVPTQALPVQSFTIPLDNNQWDIEIRTTNGTISVTLTINGTLLLSNARAVAGEKIIPCDYQENGNFVFITENFEIPDYTKFGTTQQLIYASPDDLTSARTVNTGILTDTDFDANGPLPLRFKPQGYVLG